TSRSPLLFREIRRSFSEEGYFHFKFSVAALELTDPLAVRCLVRDRLPAFLFPVRLDPEAQCGIVHSEFPRHLGNRQRVIDHLLGGLILELGSVLFRFSRHSLPRPFPNEILLDPCPE